MKKYYIKDLGKTQLWRLRQDIVLNSLYINDYQNRYGIDPRIVCDFMDGYVEELCAMAQEDGVKTDNILDIIELYDNKDNLYNYVNAIDWGY